MKWNINKHCSIAFRNGVKEGRKIHTQPLHYRTHSLQGRKPLLLWPELALDFLQYWLCLEVPCRDRRLGPTVVPWTCKRSSLQGSAGVQSLQPRPLLTLEFAYLKELSRIPLTSCYRFFPYRVFGMFAHTEDRETVYAWFTFSHWLVYANSAANPIIYNFLSGESSPVTSLQTTAQGKGWMTRRCQHSWTVGKA